MEIDWVLIAPQPLAQLGELQVGRYLPQFSSQLSLAEFSAFLLDGPNDWVEQQLVLLRADPMQGWRPVFIASEPSPLAASLADGLVHDSCLAKARYMLQIHSLLFFTQAMSADERLLHFMAMRRDARLLPQADWRQTSSYNYPLLSVLNDEDTGAEMRVQSLVARKLLEEASYVDRQYQCRHCHSAHLKLLDHCPECQSSDIQNRPALHCFTCGHVAPQDNFRRYGQLICPQCDARLRHIGSDYDRPVENYSCNACDAYFIEGHVRAVCLICTKTSELEELVNHRVLSYRLTEQGRLVAKQGRIGDIYAVLDDINYVSRDFFMHSLNWQIGMCRRHNEISFSLLGLKLLNLASLIDNHGYYRVSRLLDAFAERLRELLRQTDLCTRTDQEVFWILLPQCSVKGLLPLKQRLERVFNELIMEPAQQLECQLVPFSSEQDLIAAEDAELLLARLFGAFG